MSQKGGDTTAREVQALAVDTEQQQVPRFQAPNAWPFQGPVEGKTASLAQCPKAVL